MKTLNKKHMKLILIYGSIGILLIMFYNRILISQSGILTNLYNLTSNSWDTTDQPFEQELQTTKNYTNSLINAPILKSILQKLKKYSFEKFVAWNQVSTTSITTTSDSAIIGPANKKIILFWNKWFNTQWVNRFPDQQTLEEDKCPSFQCEFTYNKTLLSRADAILVSIRSKYTNPSAKTFYTLSQRWIYVDVEAPSLSKPPSRRSIFNWSMTYHSSADIIASYGYFTPINLTVRSIRPNMMDYESETMKRYLQHLNATGENESQLDEYPGFVTKRRLAAWMSSHCPTDSRREKLIKELQKEIEIDTFGSCGTKSCGKRSPYDPQCWNEVLAPNYIFYFSMENKLCDEYISEKLYNPLLYGLIPVVYGGANYSKFLPPLSYIDARKYAPRELAKEMLRVQNDQKLYSRYHLWRKFWKVHVGGSFCELCHKLHTDDETRKVHNSKKLPRRKEKCYQPKI